VDAIQRRGVAVEDLEMVIAQPSQCFGAVLP
jgi:hypothetical protein